MILAAAVVASRLLGLTSGVYPVAVEVSPDVAAVTILLDGAAVATLREKPWRTKIDFGPGLAPHEVAVVATNAAGAEIGRDTQFVNIARPLAEAFIDLDRKSAPPTARVRWQHVGGNAPLWLNLKLDGRKISKGEPSVVLPPLDMKKIHVLSTEVGFDANVVARKEIVFGGIYTDEQPTELSGMLVRQEREGAFPANCFHLGSQTVTPAGIEGGNPLVIFVRDGEVEQARRALRLPADTPRAAAQKLTAIPGAEMRVIFASSIRKRPADAPAISLFDQSVSVPGESGAWSMLTSIRGPLSPKTRLADAVAVAGVQALVDSRPRAVVLFLTGARDESAHLASDVRRYLERIGVPLRVWSLIPPRPEEGISAWGPVTDVSSMEKLIAATGTLRQELARQRIVWMPVPPLDALRIEAVEGCGLVPLAIP